MSRCPLWGVADFGVNVGQAKIKYLVIGLNGCKDSVIQVMKINEKPSAGLISGANMLCKGSMIILTITGNSILGGWSSNDLSVLVVNAQGQVTGLKQGNGCHFLIGNFASCTSNNFVVFKACLLFGIGYHFIFDILSFF